MMRALNTYEALDNIYCFIPVVAYFNRHKKSALNSEISRIVTNFVNQLGAKYVTLCLKHCGACLMLYCHACEHVFCRNWNVLATLISEFSGKCEPRYYEGT